MLILNAIIRLARNERTQIWILVVFFAGFSIKSFEMPFYHDYPAYIEQWKIILTNPEALRDLGTNAYGPTHNIISLVYAIHPNLPRILFCGIWIGAGVLLLRRCAKNHLPPWTRLLILFFLYINPYFFRLYKYGQNDLAVSGILLMAIILHRKKKDVPAGTLFALALSYKFYPLVMIPFLCTDFKEVSKLRDIRKSFRINFFLSVIASLAVLTALAYLTLGESFLSPYQFLVNRSITESSFAYFWQHSMNSSFFAKLGFLPVAILLTGMCIMSYIKRWSSYFSAILALLLTFLLSPVFYYVYIIGCLALLFEYTTWQSQKQLNMSDWIAPFAYVFLMSFVFILNTLLAKYPSIPLSDWKGLIYAIPNGALLVLLVGANLGWFNFLNNRKTIRQSNPLT